MSMYHIAVIGCVLNMSDGLSNLWTVRFCQQGSPLSSVYSGDDYMLQSYGSPGQPASSWFTGTGKTYTSFIPLLLRRLWQSYCATFPVDAVGIFGSHSSQDSLFLRESYVCLQMLQPLVCLPMLNNLLTNGRRYIRSIRISPTVLQCKCMCHDNFVHFTRTMIFYSNNKP